MNARIVVDASVAVKWVIAEEHSALAEALMGRQMIAPALLLIECGNALLRRARKAIFQRIRWQARLRRSVSRRFGSCQSSNICRPRSGSVSV